jgi:amidohydrolase
MSTGWADRFLEGHRAELIAFRRHLHAHPELSYDERDTTDLIAQRLEVAGLEPVLLPNECGLLCEIGSGRGPVVALRADIDALAMDDEKDVAYRSQRPGVAHACGHDVHTTIVLGAGLALQELLAGHDGRVRLIFEPAEESLPGGSVEVIDAGGLDSVAAIFGLHCDPKIDVGHVAVRSGPLTSATDMVLLDLHGPGGHTARPQLTVDLVQVAAHVALRFPEAGEGRLRAEAEALLGSGALRAADASAAIPG